MLACGLHVPLQGCLLLKILCDSFFYITLLRLANSGKDCQFICQKIKIKITLNNNNSNNSIIIIIIIT